MESCDLRHPLSPGEMPCSSGACRHRGVAGPCASIPQSMQLLWGVAPKLGKPLSLPSPPRPETSEEQGNCAKLKRSISGQRWTRWGEQELVSFPSSPPRQLPAPSSTQFPRKNGAFMSRPWPLPRKGSEDAPRAGYEQTRRGLFWWELGFWQHLPRAGALHNGCLSA